MHSEKGTEKQLAIHIKQNIAEHSGDITTEKNNSLMEKTKQN